MRLHPDILKFMTVGGLLLPALLQGANPILANLPEKTWYEARSSKMYYLCPPYTGLGAQNCVGVIHCWSGGDYSPNTREMIVWGGGHNDYYGNEVYTFNLDTLRWRMVTPHSMNTNTGSCVAVLPNGEPNSRHTYGGLAVITHADRFFGLGGSPSCLGGGCRVDVLFTLDIRTRQWHNMQPSGTLPNTACEDKSVYDPVTKKVYYHTTGGGWFAYDYDSNHWTKKSSNTACYSRSAALDPKRRLIVEVGRGTVTTFNLESTALTAQTLATTGGDAVVGKTNPGLAYDPVTDRMISWYGGADVYSLDLDSGTWERISPAADNTITPAAVTTSGGVFGRFRYVVEDNVFILVNSATQHVLFYKLTPGDGIGREKARRASPGPRMTVWPNPFKPRVTVGIELSVAADVSVSLFTLGGRQVHRFSPGHFTSGFHEWTWKPDTRAGAISPGAYILKVATDDLLMTRTIHLLR